VARRAAALEDARAVGRVTARRIADFTRRGAAQMRENFPDLHIGGLIRPETRHVGTAAAAHGAKELLVTDASQRGGQIRSTHTFGVEPMATGTARAKQQRSASHCVGIVCRRFRYGDLLGRHCARRRGPQNRGKQDCYFAHRMLRHITAIGVTRYAG
jgi:hypothetical protein